MRIRTIIAATALIALSTVAGATVANATAAGSEGPADAPLTVRVDTGLIQGAATPTTRQFLGVPYAKPPVGALRWTPPQRATPWSGVRPATQPGSRCPQLSVGPGQPASNDEDCLFVNVTTPRQQTPGSKLPVMVWWHGGGYFRGAGSDYDADRMAAQGNVIVVTLNYRLGIFGYFGLPGLPDAGNFGLADQIAGLRWAKHNAAAFGGDPSNITVFGESAGGMSTCAMLTSPAARGLVDKAIISSGSCLLDWPAGGIYPGTPEEKPYVSLANDQATSLAAAHSSGCQTDELACMRAKPAADLVAQGQNFNALAYGTPLVPQNPATALRDGHFLRVPVISGGNRDEDRAFVGGAVEFDPGAITAATYPTLLRNAFGANADRVAARYPLSNYGSSAALAWATVVTDESWACQTATADRLFAAHTTVYPYEFADRNALDVNGLNIPGMPSGATHADDLPSLFDLDGVPWMGTKGTPAQQAMAATMIGYWTTFARTGNPNHAGAPQWTAGTPWGTSQLQLIPDHVQEANVAAQHQCGFWSTVR